MKLLFIGDIFGRPGRDLVRVGLDGLIAHHDVDFVVANGENAPAATASRARSAISCWQAASM